MALFEVPGWSVPSAPIAGPSADSHSRKRKRHESEKEDSKLQSAAVNVEKLMATLGSMGGAGEESGQPKRAKKNKGKGRDKREGREETPGAGGVKEVGRAPRTQKAEDKGKKEGKKGGKSGRKSREAAAETAVKPSVQSQEKSGKKQKKKGRASDANTTKNIERSEEVAEKSVPPPQSKKSQSAAADGLTTMQVRMKQSLDGARFRWINETLYKSDSAHAHGLMRENPAVFTEYHTGFRHQVQSWPVNPVSHYISTLSSYPPKTVIVDLGCGDAALARALVPQDLTVLSYDLVSDGEFVVEADICSRIPLPGRESGSSDDGSVAQVADVVICALSLMSTNWVGCIREAWRILKPGGELKIAEVASRFVEVESFTSLVSSVGFKLRSKDDSNTHFTLFEFSKVKRKPKSDNEWAKLSAQGSVLKPCEYKRR